MPFKMNNALRSITCSKVCTTYLEDDETKKRCEFRSGSSFKEIHRLENTNLLTIL